MDKRLIAWLAGNDTGLSSKAIVNFMEGLPPSRWGYEYPRDPSDLGRCLRLLQIMPEYLQRLDEMKSISLEWRNLVDNWYELSALYYKEESSGRAPECYARMDELFNLARAERKATQP